MRLPFDVVEEYISTPVKVILARKLWSEGYTQTRIAKILGITQPTVNIYIRSPAYSEEKMLLKISRAGIDKAEFYSLVERITVLVKNGRKIDAMGILTEQVLKWLSGLRLCEAHRRLDPSIPLDCKICSELIHIPSGMNVLKALESAYERLSRERCIYILVPEVLMNIAYAKEDAASLSDIAAFPGRITKVGKTIAVVSKPSWGASRHLGKIVLKINRVRRDLRAMINIKAMRCVTNALETLGLRYVVIQPRSSYVDEDTIINDVSSAFIEHGADAVIHLGGIGIEPVTYIGGEDPVEISKIISNIASICSKEMGIDCDSE